jgi:hypothetical protein
MWQNNINGHVIESGSAVMDRNILAEIRGQQQALVKHNSRYSSSIEYWE